MWNSVRTAVHFANKLTYQTSEPDIFVGGDVYTGPKFAIDAIAAGREGRFPCIDMCMNIVH